MDSKDLLYNTVLDLFQWLYDDSIEEKREDYSLYADSSNTNTGGYRELALIKDSSLIMYYIWKRCVPEDKRDAAAEYLVRLQSAVDNIVYEMDYSDGMVQLRSTLRYDKKIPEKKVLLSSLTRQITEFDEKGKGLQAIIDFHMTPEKAYRAICGDD